MTGSAKQSIAPRKERMDCFVASPLAMTSDINPHSRGADSARVMHEVTLKKNRGRRKHRMRSRTRSLACEIRKHTSKSPQVHRAVRRFLRNGLRLLRALPGDRLFCHRRRRNCFRQLDPSVAGTGPHDFAVRVGIAGLATPSASITSCINVRDDRDAPLLWDRTRESVQLICPQAKFL
jgi:hypothetical protein